MRDYDEMGESMGLDEMNLDITDYLILHELNNQEGRFKVAEEMRTWINEVTKLTCSAGVGPNKMLAKIGSDMNKPNGTFIVEFTEEKITDLMKDMSIWKIPGIGRVTEGVLNEIGIFTCQNAIDNAPLLIMAEYDYVIR